MITTIKLINTFINSHSYLFPLSVHTDSLFSTISPSPIISYHFDKGHPNRYEVMYHCGPDFHVPNNYDIGHFNVLTVHFI